MLGEYLALVNGPALIAATAPRFELAISPTETVTTNPFPAHSPAYNLAQAHLDILHHYHLEFRDPHTGAGGFGASSAQYALLLTFLQCIEVLNPEDYPAMIKRYQNYAWNGQGTAPSGLDIVAQLNGQITYYHSANNQLAACAWPFSDINFYLLRTGHKVATHEHLASLGSFPSQALADVVEKAYASLTTAETNSSAQFVECVEQYAQLLAELGFVTPTTQNLLNTLHNNPLVKAAKGCGALGADVVLVITATADDYAFRTWAQQQSLHLVASQADLTTGIGVNDYEMA